MKNFREGRISRDQVFDLHTAWTHIYKIAIDAGLYLRRKDKSEKSLIVEFSSGNDRFAYSNHKKASIRNNEVTFTFNEGGYTMDDQFADFDRFQGDFSKGWSEFDSDLKDLLTDMINDFSKKEMKESVVPADQEEVLRSVVNDMYPQYAGLIDDYLNNGLAGCEGAFESDNALIDDFVTYAETIMDE